MPRAAAAVPPELPETIGCQQREHGKDAVRNFMSQTPAPKRKGSRAAFLERLAARLLAKRGEQARAPQVKQPAHT
jgi:hypothetical protein